MNNVPPTGNSKLSITDPGNADNAVVVRDLSFSYGGRRGCPVLEIDDWQISRGQQSFLHGPSGSGKTTLLNLLSGVLLPTSGSVQILGEKVSSLGSRQRDRFRANHIGIVFQQFNLLPWLSVIDNLRLASYFSGGKEGIMDKAEKIFARLHIAAELLHRPASSLSVGQQQRVAIARALINDPELLIADEPTSSLDSNTRAAFMELLLEATGVNKTTLLFVSHDLSLAGRFGENVALAELNKVKGGHNAA
ncbi:MAG: ATP-binding cassette domain-containing protein [bacterium]|nr:ATP-binding cassette domain-containing protein [bacterium]